MPSDRQIAANRRNAVRSTGPRTAAGKLQSRRNAYRHGLTAETVIPSLEDAEAYREIEAGLFAEFAPATPLQQQLVARLASLLWRLRRTSSIESGLYEAQLDVASPAATVPSLAIFHEMLAEQRPAGSVPLIPHRGQAAPSRDDGMARIAAIYSRINRHDPGVMKRLSRYEVALWRQVQQIMILLGGGSRLHRRRITI